LAAAILAGSLVGCIDLGLTAAVYGRPVDR
jgi:hypothetical protein